jgi:hypothetical protein
MSTVEEEMRRLRSELKFEIGALRHEVRSLIGKSDKQDGGRDGIDRSGRVQPTGNPHSECPKRTRKKEKKRAGKKRAEKKLCGMDGVVLAISVILCVTGLFVASNSGEDAAPRLLQDFNQSEVTESPSTSPDSLATVPFVEGDEPACLGSNPEICGCGSVSQADYRGPINTTKSGLECLRWDDDLVTEFLNGSALELYPDAGLENNNYCRNPGNVDMRAYCFVKGQQKAHEYCDVPYCTVGAASCVDYILPMTSIFTDDDDDASMDGTSYELNFVCSYYQCVSDSSNEFKNDNTSITMLLEEVEPTCQCSFELWDCLFGSAACSAFDCCMDKAFSSSFSSITSDNWTSHSCECSLKPDCESGSEDKCYAFAESCCEENDFKCQCEYKKKACDLALEEDSTDASIYCADAETTCCGDDATLGGCRW